jgi:hypothetical protein
MSVQYVGDFCEIAGAAVRHRFVDFRRSHMRSK